MGKQQCVTVGTV